MLTIIPTILVSLLVSEMGSVLCIKISLRLIHVWLKVHFPLNLLANSQLMCTALSPVNRFKHWADLEFLNEGQRVDVLPDPCYLHVGKIVYILKITIKARLYTL